MNKNPGHIHKLKRHHYKTGTSIYFCVDDCTFRVSTALSLGKTVICWRCGKSFRMNNYSITLDKPHCETCHVHKGNKRKKKQNESLAVVGSAMGQEVVTNLKDRMNNLLTERKVEDNPQTVEIREFKLEEDEEFL